MADQQYRPTLLDVPVSVFRQAFDNVPEKVTTLRHIVADEDCREDIESIRIEVDHKKQSDRKRRLRAFTPAAHLRHRKEETSFAEKIIHQWPLLMGDVDLKDNLGVNMAELKKRIARLPYVLLCAYSVRGGLWFLVHLPDNQTPDTLAAHFRYVQRLFSKQFGVHLDQGKGGNPTHLRYVSYDAAPHFNDSATVMDRVYTPPKPILLPARSYPQDGFNGPDEGQLLNRFTRFAESAGEGNRHDKLFRAARTAGGYIAAGRMDEQTAVYALETVASEWPTFTKSQKTIRDGIRYGMANPIYDKSPVPSQSVNHLSQRSRERIINPSHVVPTTANARPYTVLRPHESEIERLTVEPCDSYPAGWDTAPTLTI